MLGTGSDPAISNTLAGPPAKQKKQKHARFSHMMIASHAGKMHVHPN